MTEIKDPGAPRTDELARNAALHALDDAVRIAADRVTEWPRQTATVGTEAASAILDSHTVTWERDVNANGVAVRRYVLRGAWEVVPESQPTPIGHGDTVRYRDRRDGGREWYVHGTPIRDVLDNHMVSMTSAGEDDVAEHRYARAGELEVVRRAEP